MDRTRAAQLLQSAQAAKTRYEHNIHRSDLDIARNGYETLLAELPEDDPDAAAHKISLAEVYIMLGEYTGDVVHTQRGVQVAQEAVDQTPPHDPSRVGRLISLGIAYHELWSRDRVEATCQSAIEQFDSALQLAGGTHPLLANILSERGATLSDLVTHAIGEQQLQRAREAVACQEAAVRALTGDDEQRATVLRNFAFCLISHNEIAPQSERRLDDAVRFAAESVRLTRMDHYRRHRRLNMVAMAHYRRWRQLGLSGTEDMRRARYYSTQATEAVPQEHQGWRVHKFNLAASLVERYEIFGDLDDLDAAIDQLKELLKAMPSNHPHYSSRRTYLGKALIHSFRNRGLPGLLDEAIECHEDAVRMAPPAEEWRCRQDLGEVLLERFLHQREPSALDAAVETFELALTGGLAFQRDQVRANLANALATRYISQRQLPDLERSLENFQQVVNAGKRVGDVSQLCDAYGMAILARFQGLVNLDALQQASSLFADAISSAPIGHPALAKYYSHYGTAQRLLHRSIGSPHALEQSIGTLRESVRHTRPGHPLLAKHHYELASSLLDRYELDHHLHAQDGVEAASLYHVAAQDQHSFVMDRWMAAKEHAKLMHTFQHLNNALDSYRVAIALLPRLAWLGSEQQTRYATARAWISLGNDAAACAISAGRLDLAVEFLENSRSVLWNQLYQLGQGYDELRELAPDLAAEVNAVGRSLESSIRASFGQLPRQEEGRKQQADMDARSRRRLAERWESLMQQVRQRPGAENFLGWSHFSELRRAAANGPVVVINVSEYRCDGIIITGDGHSRLFPLPLANRKMIELYAIHLIQVLHDKKDLESFRFADSRVTVVLGALWREVGYPLYQVLAPFLRRDGSSRVWLMPTGPLASLPLHAAMSDDTVPACLQDFMIPSYTPTLSALLRARRQRKEPVCRMLAVGCPNSAGHRPLPCWPRERDTIREKFPPAQTTILEHDDATIDSVLRAMGENNFLHICCHGEHDWMNPYQSHLSLSDGKLTLNQIAQSKFSRAEFAFLSACHTARVDPTAPDESVHLASGMNLAGFRSIIATMWGILDQDAPSMTKIVYTFLTRQGRNPDPTDAAEALHTAVRELRRQNIPAIRWAPFIHIGL